MNYENIPNCWKNQLSIIERGLEDQYSDCLIKDKNGIIKRRLQVGFVKQQIEKYCPKNGIIWDPFCGAGTTGVATLQTDCKAILGDIGKDECEISINRINRIPHDEEQVIVQQIDILKTNISNVDFVFTSPPIIDHDKAYSKINTEIGRAEELAPDQFLLWLDLVVQKIKESMKKDAYCVIYSADIRRNKKILPYGFIIMNAFMKYLSLIDIVIIDLRNDPRRKRRCVDFQENERMRHSSQHDYMFVYQK